METKSFWDGIIIRLKKKKKKMKGVTKDVLVTSFEECIKNKSYIALKHLVNLYEEDFNEYLSSEKGKAFAKEHFGSPDPKDIKKFLDKKLIVSSKDLSKEKENEEEEKEKEALKTSMTELDNELKDIKEQLKALESDSSNEKEVLDAIKTFVEILESLIEALKLLEEILSTNIFTVALSKWIKVCLGILKTSLATMRTAMSTSEKRSANLNSLRSSLQTLKENVEALKKDPKRAINPKN